jgi:hypothetical protein
MRAIAMDSIKTVVPYEGMWIPRDFSNGRYSQGCSPFSLRNDRGAPVGSIHMKKAFAVFVLLAAFVFMAPSLMTKPQGSIDVVIQVGAPTAHIPLAAAHTQPSGEYSVVGSPTIGPAFIDKILAHYRSPAAGKGQVLSADGVKYGIDPVYALAFFMHESSFGTTGEAQATLSLGNERCIADRPCIDQGRGGYARMRSWEDGFDHWYRLILYGYVQGQITIPLVGHPCQTVEQIIPVYAPSRDHNDEVAYIQAVEHAVDVWHSGEVQV